MANPIAALFLGLTAAAGLFLGLACGEGEKSFDLSSETVVPSAEFPISLAFAPDGRLFYNEHFTGKVRIVTADGQLLEEPFARVDDLVSVSVDVGDWGLLGLELDPDFQSNHYVYIYYTQLVREVEAGEGIVVDRVAKPVVMRFTEVDNRGVDPTVILGDLPETDPHDAPFHMGGNIHVGPDGYLYVTIGEFTVGERAQDLSSVNGKILRVDKEDGAAAADNPFVDVPGADPRVFAYGLRNSFDFAFHPSTGGLYATENGPGNCDELNLIAAGQDYGWKGADSINTCVYPQGVQAIYNFAKLGTKPRDQLSGVAPTGIEFVSASVYPALEDSVLTCEWLTKFMRSLELEGEELTSVAHDDIVVRDCQLDITTSPDGIIYYSNQTEIRRLVPIDSSE